MKKIQLGIIGCGHWGPNYIRNLLSLSNSTVKYACDIQEEKMVSIKSHFPELLTTTEYGDILKDQSVEAVVISTSASSHHRLVKNALLHNKHVLVEKPFVLRIEEGQELISLAKKRHRILMVAHTFLYNMGIRKLKKLIKNKHLGKIYYLHSKRTNLGPLRNDVSVLWDLAPHDISSINYLLELEPIEVFAKGNDYLQKSKEDVVFATLTYPQNIIANIHVSWLDPRKVREITVVGDNKMAVFDDLNLKEPIHLYDKRVMKKKYKQDYSSFEEYKMIIKEGGVVIPKIVNKEPLSLECEHFISCIKNNTQPLTDAESALNVVKVLSHIQESLVNNGKAVKVR